MLVLYWAPCEQGPLGCRITCFLVQTAWPWLWVGRASLLSLTWGFGGVVSPLPEIYYDSRSDSSFVLLANKRPPGQGVGPIFLTYPQQTELHLDNTPSEKHKENLFLQIINSFMQLATLANV